jgi:hypothetical protein
VILINELEYPDIDYTGGMSSGRPSSREWSPSLGPGQYARAFKIGCDVILARDPLGCNKLFYGLNAGGDLVVASRINRALELGVHLDGLASCPPGHVMRFSDDGVDSVKKDLGSWLGARPFDLACFQERVAAALDRAMEHLTTRFSGALFVVCLSGGLDSSIVASRAKRALDNVVAVSFSLLSVEDSAALLRGARPEELETVSDDFSSAVAVARELDMRLFPVFRTPASILESVPAAVRLCQDWRDFNVHCAAVNLALAQDIRGLFPGRRVAALTGDLMNELVCDYSEEVIDGTVYYPQPRVPIETRRRFLVRGLDAGDRELGVFNAFGIPAVQLFSAVADQYLEVPGEMLGGPDAKKNLNGHLLGPGLLDVVSTSKRRAQVGGVDQGVLGVFHLAGITQAELEQVWIRSLPEGSKGDKPLDIIQFGRYRTAPLRDHEPCAE